MTTSDQKTTEREGLAIFDDVHEVRGEAAGVVGLQLMAVVLSYSFIIGVVVLVVVLVGLAVSLLWPVLLAMVFPWAVDLVNARG